MRDSKDNIRLLNIETGEVLDESLNDIRTDIIKELTDEKLQLNRNIKNANNRKNIENEFYMIIDRECGSFYANFYDKTNKIDYIFRFMYLCTFIDYDNNIIVYKPASSKYATKKDLLGIFDNITRKANIYDTINYFEEKNLIICDENGYYSVNKKYCKRGKITNKKRNETIRIFDNSKKYLYENSSTKEHNLIGLLFKLLPYVNKDTNAVVYNPSDDIGELKPMKQADIIRLLSVDKNTVKKLFDINICNDTESAFIKVSNPMLKNVFIINPRFVYGGNKLEEFNELLGLFKMGYK